MPEAILFDLDNTLYDEREYVFGILDEFCHEHGLDAQQARSAYLVELESASRDILGGVLKRIGFYTPVLQQELFERYQTTSVRVRLYKDAKNVLAELRSRGIKTGILTNGACQAQRNKVRCLGVEPLVDKVIYARDYGVTREKPHNTGYQALLNQLQVNVQDAVFVGDSLQTDIEGANRMNMSSVLIRRPEQTPALADHGPATGSAYSHAVADLDELLSILEIL